MSQAVGEKIRIEYMSPNVGKHPVRGMSTKEYYGYRRRGDQFDVYESDMRVRPDLYRPVHPIEPVTNVVPSHRGRPQESANVLGVTAVAEPVQVAPAPPVELDTEPYEPDPYELPPPLEMEPQVVVHDPRDSIHNATLDMPLNAFDWGGKVNKRHLSILEEKDITTLGDLIPLTEDNVLSINGIGEGVTRALFSKLKEHNI